MGWSGLGRRLSGLAEFVSPEGRLRAPRWYYPEPPFGTVFCFSGPPGSPQGRGGQALPFPRLPAPIPPARPAFTFTTSTWDSFSSAARLKYSPSPLPLPSAFLKWQKFWI